MNRMILCFGAFVLLCIVAIFAITLPLEGMRGVPWLNFRLWQLVALAGVALVVGCCFSARLSSSIAVFIGNWIRAGGFWAVWSKSNVPGNTWVVIAIIATVNAITYGPPTPKIDWQQSAYDAQVSIVETVNQPPVQTALSGAKDFANYLSKGFVGKELIADSQVSYQPQALAPLYQRSWRPIYFLFFCLLFAPLVFIWGRRDDMTDRVQGWIDWIKQKQEETSASSEGGAKPNFLTALMRIPTHGFGQLFTSDLLSELLVSSLGGFLTGMKKF